MAVPPLPLASIAEQIQIAVVAEVQAVWDETQQRWSEQPATGSPEPGPVTGGQAPIGAAPALPAQRCRLHTQRVLKGEPGELVEVDKPRGAYVLVPGLAGPFLLGAGEQRPVILGRYGPDSYPVEEIEALLSGGDE